MSTDGESSSKHPTRIESFRAESHDTRSEGGRSSSQLNAGDGDDRLVNLSDLTERNRDVTDSDMTETREFVEQLAAGQVILNRYEIRECLGSGGFGTVFSAFDRELGRLVAIKQARSLKSFVGGQVREEARKIASLNHPNIVQIYDLIERGDDERLIIMEHLEGVPLSKKLKDSSLTISSSVDIAIDVCDALLHAHARQLVHSDLKPANLYLCQNNRVKLLDFGLAVAYFPHQKTRIGGTAGYMSPEQIRGESHLIDGRTDIWAFGIVLYEMLTKTRPFTTKDKLTTHARTLFKLAPPPQQLNPSIDNELQRIVLKCLEPLITSRYSSVTQLRDDLVHWKQHRLGSTKANHREPTALPQDAVPSTLRLSRRGLQPFSESDASVYLPLIPGPRDRNNIPDSIRFWNRWIMSDDPQTDHPVGVLFGPSGSGKTSYVRAGLFSQLGPEVCRVYLECRPGDLAGRLTKVIESKLDSPTDASSLRDVLHQFRSGSTDSHPYQKLLIVLDQFESWAQGATLDERLNLAEALRQCDGLQIRALIITRVDYWIGTKELLHWLEVPMQEGRNVASVDLLNQSEAERILEVIGREQGTLPEQGELSKDQRLFLSQAVRELADDGKVICVHLVMFAEMVRRTHWSPRSLRDSGGVSGACSLFFQELFEKESGHSPEYRRIAPAVPIVLTRLTPLENDSVLSQCVSRAEISNALHDAGHAHLIDDTLRLLSEDLRIITVVGIDQSSDSSEPRDVQYRLAHDFLIEPVMTFLIRLRKQSWRGRTMSRLIEMSETWSRRPNPMYLPGFFEYLVLSFGTVFQQRSATDSRFLRAATRLHAGRISISMISLLGVVFLAIVTWYQWNAANEARQAQLSSEVARFLDSQSAEEFRERTSKLDPFGRRALNQIIAFRQSENGRTRLIATLFEQSIKKESFAEVIENLDAAPKELFPVVLEVAEQTPDAQTLLNDVASASDDDNNPVENLRSDRAAILLAYLGDPGPLRTRLEGGTDRERDRRFVEATLNWRGTPERWSDFLMTADSPRVRYHAGVVLAGYPVESLKTIAPALDLPALVNSADAAVHSIGRYLAKHLGQDPFALTLDPPTGANWRLGPEGQPMIRFSPATISIEKASFATSNLPPRIDEYSVDQPFWLSSLPVSESLYRQFAADLQAQGDEFNTNRNLERFDLPDYLINDPNQTAVGMNLSQAYRLCNWLSTREGLQPCFVAKTIEDSTPSDRAIPEIPWTVRMDADGYRVLTDAEFWLVAASGYSTVNSELAVQLVAANGSELSSKPQARPLMSLIPNRSGVFFFDRFNGTWICNDPMITGYNITENSAAKGFSQTYGVPTGGLYLCRRASD